MTEYEQPMEKQAYPLLAAGARLLPYITRLGGAAVRGAGTAGRAVAGKAGQFGQAAKTVANQAGQAAKTVAGKAGKTAGKVLESTGKATEDYWNTMKAHPYYTASMVAPEVASMAYDAATSGSEQQPEAPQAAPGSAAPMYKGAAVAKAVLERISR